MKEHHLDLKVTVRIEMSGVASDERKRFGPPLTGGRQLMTHSSGRLGWRWPSFTLIAHRTHCLLMKSREGQSDPSRRSLFPHSTARLPTVSVHDRKPWSSDHQSCLSWGCIWLPLQAGLHWFPISTAYFSTLITKSKAPQGSNLSHTYFCLANVGLASTTTKYKRCWLR